VKSANRHANQQAESHLNAIIIIYLATNFALLHFNIYGTVINHQNGV